jgi:hypothetical protein
MERPYHHPKRRANVRRHVPPTLVGVGSFSVATTPPAFAFYARTLARWAAAIDRRAAADMWRFAPPGRSLRPTSTTEAAGAFGSLAAFCALILAHLARCAAAIRRRAGADTWRSAAWPSLLRPQFQLPLFSSMNAFRSPARSKSPTHCSR